MVQFLSCWFSPPPLIVPVSSWSLELYTSTSLTFSQALHCTPSCLRDASSLLSSSFPLPGYSYNLFTLLFHLRLVWLWGLCQVYPLAPSFLAPIFLRSLPVYKSTVITPLEAENPSFQCVFFCMFLASWNNSKAIQGQGACFLLLHRRNSNLDQVTHHHLPFGSPSLVTSLLAKQKSPQIPRKENEVLNIESQIGFLITEGLESHTDKNLKAKLCRNKTSVFVWVI